MSPILTYMYMYLRCLHPSTSIYTVHVQVTDEYQRRLEDLFNVERHLLQAKAKALAEDERKLSSSTSLPSGEDIVLPNGPSQFRKLLSEELLSRHHLLSPSEYLPQPLAPRDAPKGTCIYNLMHIVYSRPLPQATPMYVNVYVA